MTENRVIGSNTTGRSLSALYQADVRRDASCVCAEAEDLLALGAAGAVDAAVLERLARTPDAIALHGIARALSTWSVAVAEDFRRVRSREVTGAARVRNWGWVSLAAAAGLAICVVGLGLREEAGESMQAAVQPAADTDILFADPDSAMVAAVPAPSRDSIFNDGLDS